MKKSLSIAIAQLNLFVGDLKGNKAKILKAYKKFPNADLVVFSELTATGYPVEDLVLKEHFRQESMQAIDALAEATKKGPAMLVGGIWSEDNQPYNCIFLLSEGKVVHRQAKYDLPNYGVFDEKRIFKSGPLPKPINFKGVKLGLMVCEDMWNIKVAQSLKGAEILISTSASPYEVGKYEMRLERAGLSIDITGAPLIYTNQICGQDDIVFDGGCFVYSADKEIRAMLPKWQEKVILTQWQKKKAGWVCEKDYSEKIKPVEDDIYNAITLGLKDYVKKNGFHGVVLGLSGGIDSALAAAVAVDGLGAENVWGVMLKSRHTSKQSLDDAKSVAKKLGIKYEVMDIEPMVKAFGASLAPTFKGTKPGLAEENIQSRVRGVVLMALSNKFGPMLITTGNKSEISVGYATLYGDMCGGFNPLKDVYKTQVFALSRWRNAHMPYRGKGPKGKVIPEAVITKAPTAELRENQKDEDSLPPYGLLDQVLERMVEKSMSAKEVIEEGFDEEVVVQISGLLYGAEYKRNQSAPGAKVTSKSFGRDRRYPITNRYRGGV
jgi:NAD+ synthase